MNGFGDVAKLSQEQGRKLGVKGLALSREVGERVDIDLPCGNVAKIWTVATDGNNVKSVYSFPREYRIRRSEIDQRDANGLDHSKLEIDQ